jgi:hypothetical protein
MIRLGIIHIILFFVYVLVQVMLFKNLVLFDSAFCFLYVAFILLLPFELSTLLIILIGFIIGFTIDIFYSSMGLHAFATVLMSYLRNYWLSVITPQGGYDTGNSPTIATNGVQWFLVYAIPLVFIHHFVLFFLEASGFDMFWFTMLKIMGSLLFTMTVIVFLQFLVPRGRRI